MSFSVGEIRSEFTKYFVEKGHENVESSSLIPENDPSLMFVNSGMVQFKDVFAGNKTLPYKKATTVQKCLRAGGKHNDLENVGYTSRHHTFFEMLGNFSFGDYFKDDAISFAWEFLTKNLGLKKEKLLVTIHDSDAESGLIWKKVSGLDDKKIIKISTNDNFWSMGNVGPCGPCSEIFYDHGEDVKGGIPGSAEQDGDRFVEIWNIVFMQFDMLKNGTKAELPMRSIDTGMGIERLSAVLQGVESNYQIDLFQTIIKEAMQVTNTEKYCSSHNVIADHMRAIVFMIADGITPSNERQGYVLRRIIRRALRHGYLLGMREPFLHKLIGSVQETMGEHYREIARSDYSERTLAFQSILFGEEESFMGTIDHGMSILQNELKKLGCSKIFPADTAYKLYDTFGFPFDLTQDILKSENKIVDIAEFNKISEAQKETSKQDWAGTGKSSTAKVWHDIKASMEKPVEFVRDTAVIEEATLLYIIKDDKLQDEACEGEEVFMVFDKTPFYAEAGGQAGDIGGGFSIHYDARVRQSINVLDTQIIGGVHAHKCTVIIFINNDYGSPQYDQTVVKKGDTFQLELDVTNRQAVSRNHTATHLVHQALKNQFGNQIVQKGASSTHEKLRFDFSCSEKIIPNDRLKIESFVRNTIKQKAHVEKATMKIDDALASGAVALFGEKYPDEVRVVTISRNHWNDLSKELCCGTHVDNTSKIGAFEILSIKSIGASVKRIECITGYAAVTEYYKKKLRETEQTLDETNNQNKAFKQEIEKLKTANLSSSSNMKTENINNICIRHCEFENSKHKAILGLIDSEKKHNDERCVIIFNKLSKTNVAVLVFVSKMLLVKVDALSIVKFAQDSLNLDIKFGGRADLVQFAKMPEENIVEFVACVKSYINNIQKLKDKTENV